MGSAVVAALSSLGGVAGVALVIRAVTGATISHFVRKWWHRRDQNQGGPRA